MIRNLMDEEGIQVSMIDPKSAKQMIHNAKTRELPRKSCWFPMPARTRLLVNLPPISGNLKGCNALDFEDILNFCLKLLNPMQTRCRRYGIVFAMSWLMNIRIRIRSSIVYSTSGRDHGISVLSEMMTNQSMAGEEQSLGIYFSLKRIFRCESGPSGTNAI